MTSTRKLGLEDLAVLLPTSYTTRQPQTKRTPTRPRVTPATIAARLAEASPLAEQSSTPLTGTVVIGTVLWFNETKGYGVAQTIITGVAKEIFFHKNASRVVIGTADEPQLLNTFKEQYVTAKPPRPSEIAMIVEEGPKGLRATAWGIRPKRDWRADAINLENGFQRFVGGTVSVRADYDDPKPTDRYSGTLADISLSLTELQIVITNGTKFESGDSFGTPCDTVAMCFKLKDSYLDSKTEGGADYYTSKTIIVHLSSGRRQRISLRMPTHSNS